MDSWHATFLGLRHLPREVTAFEVEVFFQFSAEEARIIEERRRPELKLGLALQMGFLRMSGRLLDAVRMVPPLLWRHLGERFSVAAPDGVVACDVPARPDVDRTPAARLRGARIP